MAVTSKYFSGAEKGHETDHEEHDPRELLMYDPKPRGEMNQMVMESMMTTSWKFWVCLVFWLPRCHAFLCLAIIWRLFVAVCAHRIGVSSS